MPGLVRRREARTFDARWDYDREKRNRLRRCVCDLARKNATELHRRATKLVRRYRRLHDTNDRHAVAGLWLAASDMKTPSMVPVPAGLRECNRRGARCGTPQLREKLPERNGDGGTPLPAGLPTFPEREHAYPLGQCSLRATGLSFGRGRLSLPHTAGSKPWLQVRPAGKPWQHRTKRGGIRAIKV